MGLNDKERDFVGYLENVPNGNCCSVMEQTALESDKTFFFLRGCCLLYYWIPSLARLFD